MPLSLLLFSPRTCQQKKITQLPVPNPMWPIIHSLRHSHILPMNNFCCPFLLGFLSRNFQDGFLVLTSLLGFPSPRILCRLVSPSPGPLGSILSCRWHSRDWFPAAASHGLKGKGCRTEFQIPAGLLPKFHSSDNTWGPLRMVPSGSRNCPPCYLVRPAK